MSSRKMRLFTGIAIPQAITEGLEAVVASIRPAAAIRWSPLTNLHITTKFIGAWAEERLDELKNALARVSVPPGLEIQISGFGFYPAHRHPKVFFARVRAPRLTPLHAAIEDALEPLGCARDDRHFAPHLTLARIGREDLRGLHQRLTQLNDPDFGSFLASEFQLYLSAPGPQGSVYNSLAAFSSEPEAIAC